MAIAFFSWLAGPLLVPVLVGVAAALDQPAGLVLGGLAAVWWSGCLVLLVRHVGSGRAPRTRPSRDRLLTRVVGRVLWWVIVGCIWSVTASAVTLTVALQRIPTRNGGTPLDFDRDGSALLAVGEALGWAALGLAVLGPVVAWLTAPREAPVSDPQRPAGP